VRRADHPDLERNEAIVLMVERLHHTRFATGSKRAQRLVAIAKQVRLAL
jgi:hypothetical protein